MTFQHKIATLRLMAKRIPTEDYWLTQSQAAQSCGVSVPAFVKWNVPHVAVSGRSKYYTVEAIIANRLAAAERRQGKKEASISDATVEKARLVKEQADHAELKNAKMRGELAPIQIIETTLAGAAAQIAAVLETIPMKLKRRNPSLTASDIEIIKKEITAVQNMAAEVNIDPDELDYSN